MMRPALLLLTLLATAQWPARAVCYHNGEFSVKTTLEQEFGESRWVVRARLVEADYHWANEGESWALYRLEVVESYKGALPRQFTFFTARNSGGFYFDRDGGGPDFDGEYLLFLVPNPRARTDPPAARDALWVNYTCGQSKRWDEVTADEAGRLRKLTGQAAMPARR